MSVENSNLDLRIDFKNDWAEILRQKMIEIGYSIDPKWDATDLCLKYFNVVRRRIEPKPRRVLVSQEFVCPNDHLAGINLIRQKVETGQDLTPHLNKIHRPGDPDLLLSDWDIYHFHLGTSFTKSGYVERTGPLLFARVTSENFYMLDVVEHGRWSEQRFVEIIHNNWRESISAYSVPLRLITLPPTDEDVADFRRSGINTAIQVSDGTTYLAIGGGYALPGISIDVRVTCSSYAATIRNLENHVKSNLSHLIKAAHEQGIVLPSQMHFQLQIINDEAYAVELNSNVGFKLCEMPLQLLNKNAS